MLVTNMFHVPVDLLYILVYPMEVTRTETVWLPTFFTICLVFCLTEARSSVGNLMASGPIDFNSIEKNTLEVNGTQNCLLPTFFKISSFVFHQWKKKVGNQTFLYSTDLYRIDKTLWKSLEPKTVWLPTVLPLKYLIFGFTRRKNECW